MMKVYQQVNLSFVTNESGKGKKMTLVALRKYNKNQDIIDALNKVH
jgi:hypothetical protein